MGLGNIEMQAWLVVWTLGAPLVIAIISVFVDGTLDRSVHSSATVTRGATS